MRLFLVSASVLWPIERKRHKYLCMVQYGWCEGENATLYKTVLLIIENVVQKQQVPAERTVCCFRNDKF